MRPVPTAFVEPLRVGPVDLPAALDAIPPDAKIAGMFVEPLVAEARRIGAKLPSARERYTTFAFYPLRHHATVLVEACAAVFPRLSQREALRKLGRGAPRALLASTLGRVTLGSVEGVHEMLLALLKTYPINLPSSRTEVLEATRTGAIVRLESVPFFLDSHHVGVLEGTLRHAGVNGRVEVCVHSPSDADFRCTWA